MIQDIVLSNRTKIIFLILDGLGDIPHPGYSYRTPLEAATKPNIDDLAMRWGILGRAMPVDVGVTPGSGPGHLSLFGYDPVTFAIGRGVLETLGLDMDLQEGDLAARANFCTLKDGIVVDRRAGRIATEETERLCALISARIPDIEGVKVLIKPGKSHRFALIFRGQGLSDKLTDADPHKDNLPLAFTTPKEADADLAARIVNEFMRSVFDVLNREEIANGILLRGFSMKPHIPPFSVRYKLSALAIATYPMYRGIAKVLGMDVRGEPRDYREMIRILKDNYDAYQFFFFHIKETDVAGEDGNFPEKVRAIEAVDEIVPEIYGLNPQVLVLTGDHSTPCVLKGHSWHPVPLMIATKTGERDGMAFHEKNCVLGSIGTIYSKQLMPLALAHGFKLDKYGA
jgi:2,3-bisphosphoglycerate-independent phosphoglycerate mutase